MTTEDMLDSLHTLNYTASVNQRYHQVLAKKWSRIDRVVRIGVGFSAAASVVVSFSGPVLISSAVSVVGLLAAIALNVFPLLETQLQYHDLFRRWKDLLMDVEELELVVKRAPKGKAPTYVIERYTSLLAKRHQIEVDEPAPDRSLLRVAQEEENLYRYNVRSYEEVMSKMRQAPASSKASKPEAVAQA
jgi:hypothetical protein